ncbi:hypothetical protein [Actinoplanes aureus]|uniref:Uncharacterized protein n=1 Tax=Actinoplanes aureus TaxID=2792083 RepID=A0A931CEJ7_9ACTN|nr:hypothetical protein [Actinoplanes aureus]MBG0568445.1 hypothetical protein [Actinoplanes aureus]
MGPLQAVPGGASPDAVHVPRQDAARRGGLLTVCRYAGIDLRGERGVVCLGFLADLVSVDEVGTGPVDVVHRVVGADGIPRQVTEALTGR